MDKERRGIITTYEMLHEAIRKTHDSLVTNLETQYAGQRQKLDF